MKYFECSNLSSNLRARCMTEDLGGQGGKKGLFDAGLTDDPN